MSELALATYK